MADRAKAKEEKIVEEEIAEPKVPPLSDDEIVVIRWEIFGCCPICGNHVRDWNPGPFSAERYRYWQEQGMDVVSGHKQTCTEKWRK